MASAVEEGIQMFSPNRIEGGFIHGKEEISRPSTSKICRATSGPCRVFCCGTLAILHQGRPQEEKAERFKFPDLMNKEKQKWGGAYI